MATGTCPTCGQEDIPLVRRKWLRWHLVDPKSPMGKACTGRIPVELPPTPLRVVDRNKSQPSTSTRMPAGWGTQISVRTVSGGAVESNRRKH
jgi:hypothetical protein